MPVYSLAWAITCAGFTTTVSKLTAQEKAKGEEGNVRQVLGICVTITTLLGLITGGLVYLLADEIAQNFFRDERITLSLRILSLAIPFMSAGSCLRGYFLGLQRPLVPSLNQVFEQCVRMAVVFFIAGMFVPLGLEYATAAATIGILAEEAFSFVFVFVSYKLELKGRMRKRPTMRLTAAYSSVLAMALPLTANRVTGSFLSAFENALIPQRLQVYGMSSSEAISLFGQMTGMAMPLIYFPTAFLVSLAVSLVPAVSEAHAVRNLRQIAYTADKSMLLAGIVGFGSAGLFVVFAEELGQVIYNQDISHMLISLGMMSPFIYMQVVLSGILNGLGFQMFIFANSLVSSVINIAFVYFLVPVWGMDAFILGWLVSLVVIFGFEIRRLQQSVELRFEFGQWFVKPLISCVAAGLIVRYIAYNYIFGEALGGVLGLVAAIAIFASLYVGFIFSTGCLSLNEVNVLRKAMRSQA